MGQQGPCAWSKLVGPSGLSIHGFTQQLSRLRVDGEVFLVSGEFEMLTAWSHTRVGWGVAARQSSRLPPSGRWTSSSGREMPDGKVPAHRANFRLHSSSSSSSSLHKAPCATQLRFKLRDHPEGKANMHKHMHPCPYVRVHARNTDPSSRQA